MFDHECDDIIRSRPGDLTKKLHYILAFTYVKGDAMESMYWHGWKIYTKGE